MEEQPPWETTSPDLQSRNQQTRLTPEPTGEALAPRPSDDDPANPMQGNATVSVDIHTNTVIVVASPEVQRVYAALIEHLDQRRPQVLIEAKIVIIDTSDDYTLGVEVSGGDRSGTDRLFAFNSYGLSDVDPVTGSLQILPGIGFNGTLVDPSTADVVVRAIANHRRARILSTPRVLVNDNAEGQLTSVLEVPFTSVNASQTVATTSFAGFAEAGTTITATPTISDDNYLQLEYTVTLNSFSGGGSEGVPPPRQTNEVRSRVTVPDGYTVIVGGLVSKNGSFEVNSIPWVENIPILRNLASLRTQSDSETSLFVFLKPVILREDKFKDLKFYSEIDLKKSELHSNFPVSRPLTIQ
jgi:general secretion pathway protein D